MPQALLPMIPGGATQINELISVVCEGEEWTYFCGVQPVFRHASDDKRSFRMFTAQLCCQGACTQAEILRIFGVSKNSLLRSVKKYREEGVDGFYRPRRARSGGRVLTPEVSTEAQRLLDLGRTRREAAKELGIHYDTLRKAINAGRLREPPLLVEEDPEKLPVSDPPVAASDKSSRSDADAAAGEEMGVACTRPCERVMAALGLLPGGATIRFQPCRDVSYGGVLCALPALAENGIFRHLETLPVVSGYYMKLHVIVLLAYMALCRIKAVEQLQYEVAVLKERMASTPRHLAWDDVPEEHKFERLAPSRRRLTDTVKLVAYRSETALAMIVREELSRTEDARALIRDLLRSDADIHPEEGAGVLEVRLHTLANPRSNRAIQHLLNHLNAAECVYPGTNLRLTYTLSSAPGGTAAS